VNERARARGHARLRADEHERVVCAHSIFFELRRKGVAGHRPHALLVWGVPHQGIFYFIIATIKQNETEFLESYPDSRATHTAKINGSYFKASECQDQI